MKEIKTDSLIDLLKTVKALNKDNKYWFRGHADSSYVLLPSTYRKLIVVQDQFYRPVEPREILPTDTHGDIVLLPDKLYLNSFFSELDRLKINYDKNMNIVEKYCLAQHYGVWTPMLDWTTDFSVCCFFACDGRKNRASSDIYLLDPVKWNKMFGINKVLDSNEIIEINDIFPLAMKGAKDDKRMCRQSGNFTVHGNQVKSLGDYDTDINSDVLIRITISAKVANELADYLASFGINKDSVYVENDIKDSVSKSLKAINEDTFNRIINEYKEIWLNTPDENRGVPYHIL